MKVLFVYPSPILGEAPLGLLYLSAVLKKAGHKTALFELSPYRINLALRRHNPLKRDLLHHVAYLNPDLVGFSVDSTQYPLAIELSQCIKDDFDVPVVFGGAHPTVNPEDVIRQDSVDLVCVGEGEYALLELLTRLEEDPSRMDSVPNIWVKRKSEGSTEIVRNPVRHLAEDLDSLPYADRDILRREVLLNEFNGANFITSRGCPYQCPYCINAFLQKLYRGKGGFIRYRSADSVIDEIKSAVKKYGIKKVTFSDEVFTLNKKRMLNLCKLYKQEIGLPFLCQTHVGTVDSESLKALKDAGCEYVSLGVESGNDHIRNNILRRNMPRESIIDTFKLCKQIGLKTASFNMVGVPYETESNIWDTIELNRLIHPNLLMCTIFMPFKGTELGKLCEEKGWVKREIDGSYYKSMVHEMETMSPQRVMAYAQLFNLYVNFSKRYYPLLKGLQAVTERLASHRALYLAQGVLIKKLSKHLPHRREGSVETSSI